MRGTRGETKLCVFFNPVFYPYLLLYHCAKTSLETAQNTNHSATRRGVVGGVSLSAAPKSPKALKGFCDFEHGGELVYRAIVANVFRLYGYNWYFPSFIQVIIIHLEKEYLRKEN